MAIGRGCWHVSTIQFVKRKKGRTEVSQLTSTSRLTRSTGQTNRQSLLVNGFSFFEMRNQVDRNVGHEGRNP